MFTVAIAGRPNVGKSTLFNRLTKTRAALVHDVPGLTRDRKEGMVTLGHTRFRLVDTAGLEDADGAALASRMTQQALKAVADADVTLFVVDGDAGMNAEDMRFAALLRRTAKHVLLLANKADTKTAQAQMHEWYSLGLGAPVPVSAAHGDGMAELMHAVLARMPEESSPVPKDTSRPLKLAIIGRPNAGKSTLINALLKEDRVLTGPEAGITRDAIAIPFAWDGIRVELIDTAGMRKAGRVSDVLEKLSVMDARRSIDFADVVVLVVDASAPMEKQDLTIAADAIEEGRALVIAVNKCDTVSQVPLLIEDISERISDVLAQVRGVPVIPVCALRKQGLKALMDAAVVQYGLWQTKLTTGALNRWLEGALDRHAPPLIRGRRLKIRYITQTGSRPPSFMLFVNLSEVPGHYLRYLTTDLREAFTLPGVPLRLQVKKGENPYAKKAAR